MYCASFRNIGDIQTAFKLNGDDFGPLSERDPGLSVDIPGFQNIFGQDIPGIRFPAQFVQTESGDHVLEVDGMRTWTEPQPTNNPPLRESWLTASLNHLGVFLERKASGNLTAFQENGLSLSPDGYVTYQDADRKPVQMNRTINDDLANLLFSGLYQLVGDLHEFSQEFDEARNAFELKDFGYLPFSLIAVSLLAMKEGVKQFLKISTVPFVLLHMFINKLYSDSKNKTIDEGQISNLHSHLISNDELGQSYGRSGIFNASALTLDQLSDPELYLLAEYHSKYVYEVTHNPEHPDRDNFTKLKNVKFLLQWLNKRFESMLSTIKPTGLSIAQRDRAYAWFGWHKGHTNIFEKLSVKLHKLMTVDKSWWYKPEYKIREDKTVRWHGGLSEKSFADSVRDAVTLSLSWFMDSDVADIKYRMVHGSF